MAVTSIWPITRSVQRVIDYATNPEKTTEESSEVMAAFHSIKGVVQYAANDMKTETRSYVTCLNCISEDTAAQEFMETKKLWGKEGGRLCFHGYQSFKEDEVDAGTAHRIGVELAQKLWGSRFQVVIATHCNTGHYHNHFILNSVSFLDGLHFDNRPEDYKTMREVSDDLCRKYRISVIENPSGHGRNYGEYMAEKEGRPTYRGMIRADIDRAIAASITREEFIAFMRKAGYEFKLYKENGEPLERPGLKPPGAKGYFRFNKLGEGYDLEEIDRRILKNLQRKPAFSEAERKEVKQYRSFQSPPVYYPRKSSLYRLYLRYCYELHIIEKHPASVKRVSFFLREDLARLDRLDRETRLVAKLGINSAEEMLAHRNELTRELNLLDDTRHELKNEMRRAIRREDTPTAESVRAKISEITKEMREKRKEVGLCDDILMRSAQTKEELEWLLENQESENSQRKEENENELFGRSGGPGRENEHGRS